MTHTFEELYASLVLAAEADLKNTTNQEEKDLLLSYPEYHLSILKSKKKEIEYQFVAHKVIMQDYLNDYLLGAMQKDVYRESILEERTWRSKAVSVLTRIEVRMIGIKAKLCSQTKEEKSS